MKRKRKPVEDVPLPTEEVSALAVNAVLPGGEPIRLKTLELTNQDDLNDLRGLLDHAQEVLNERDDERVPVFGGTLPKTAFEVEREFADHVPRAAALWNAFLDERPGWTDKDCHNLSLDETETMLDLLSIAMKKRP